MDSKSGIALILEAKSSPLEATFSVRQFDRSLQGACGEADVGAWRRESIGAYDGMRVYGVFGDRNLRAISVGFKFK